MYNGSRLTLILADDFPMDTDPDDVLDDTHDTLSDIVDASSSDGFINMADNNATIETIDEELDKGDANPEIFFGPNDAKSYWDRPSEYRRSSTPSTPHEWGTSPARPVSSAPAVYLLALMVSHREKDLMPT